MTERSSSRARAIQELGAMARGEHPPADPLAEYCPECRAVAGANCRAYGTGLERTPHDERIARARAQAWRREDGISQNERCRREDDPALAAHYDVIEERWGADD